MRTFHRRIRNALESGGSPYGVTIQLPSADEKSQFSRQTDLVGAR